MGARRSIDVEGFNHGSLPIPAASRVGPLVETSGVHGMDPATGKLPEDVHQQTKQMFANLRRIMTAAGQSGARGSSEFLHRSPAGARNGE
jgi:enamine deaminase RidA (YjgF/YER057c/UK114 family)